MRAPIDDVVEAWLRDLTRRNRDEPPDHIYRRVAALATKAAVSAAFRARLKSDPCCSDMGRLNASGRRLSALRIESFERTESHAGCEVHARARLRAARLHWTFKADETLATACLILRASRDVESEPASLLRLDVTRSPLGSLRFRVDVRPVALVRLDDRLVGSGLDPIGLCHVLIGLLPEIVDEEWECDAQIMDALLRRSRQQQAEASLGRRWWCQRHWWKRMGVAPHGKQRRD